MLLFIYLLIHLLFWDRVSSSPSWPWACSVDKDALELLILLFPPLKCWYDSHYSCSGRGYILQSTNIYSWSFPSWRAGDLSWFLIPGGHLLPWIPQHLKLLQMFFLTPCWVSGWLLSCNGWHDLPSFFMGTARLTWSPCTESPSAAWWGCGKHILHVIYWVLHLCWSVDNAHHLQSALLFLVDATCRGFDTNLLCSGELGDWRRPMWRDIWLLLLYLRVSFCSSDWPWSYADPPALAPDFWGYWCEWAMRPN